MRPWSHFGQCAGTVLLLLAAPTAARAQAGGATLPPTVRVSMEEAVRLALEHNRSLRAQRLSVDLSKADEITAGLKPNVVFTATNENFPVFSPGQITWDNIKNNQNFVESFGYLFERGGKRNNRQLVAADTTTVAARTVADAERQVVFQTRQAFINVLL